MATKRSTGRPSDYSQKTADIICERLSDGESLRAICRDESMPNKATVFRWLAAHKSFSDQYTYARDAQADEMFDDILQIADDGQNDTYKDEDGRERTDQDVIARSRLRVDARKWMLSKMAPKKYGDKLNLEGGGEGGALVVVVKDYTGRKKADDAAG